MRYELGVAEAAKGARAQNPNVIDLAMRGWALTYLNLAAAYSFKGEMDEAKAATAEARRLNPNLSIKWLMQHKPVLQFAFDGLRRAGLPEE